MRDLLSHIKVRVVSLANKCVTFLSHPLMCIAVAHVSVCDKKSRAFMCVTTECVLWFRDLGIIVDPVGSTVLENNKWYRARTPLRTQSDVNQLPIRPTHRIMHTKLHRRVPIECFHFFPQPVEISVYARSPG